MTGSLISCSRHQSNDDITISVSNDDAEMNAAIAKARAALPDFWRVFEKRGQGETNFALKVRITDKEGVEHFWAVDIERKDGKIFGTINNDPDIVQNVKFGDRITVNDADISDWLYLRNGKMVGNYTCGCFSNKCQKVKSKNTSRCWLTPDPIVSDSSKPERPAPAAASSPSPPEFPCRSRGDKTQIKIRDSPRRLRFFKSRVALFRCEKNFFEEGRAYAIMSV